jgi:hypothetical protein
MMIVSMKLVCQPAFENKGTTPGRLGMPTIRLIISGSSVDVLQAFVARHRQTDGNADVPNLAVAVLPPPGTEPVEYSLHGNEWFATNWGCRWNASVSGYVQNAIEVTPGSDSIPTPAKLSWIFTTPLGVPGSWFRAVREQHPDLSFKLFWVNIDDFPISGEIGLDGAVSTYGYDDELRARAFCRYAIPQLAEFYSEEEDTRNRYGE